MTSIVSIAGMVMALLTVVGVQQAAAAPGPSTFQVCASGCAFTTISAAVNIAAPGDTVVVAAGTYPESVTVDKALNLRGAQAGAAAVNRTPGSADEAIIDVSGTAGARGITITAAGVNVSGFEIKTSQTGTAIWMKSHTSNHAISDNILHAGQFAVALDSSDATFDGNKVLIGAYTTDGLINQSGPGSDWTVSNNTFAVDSGATAPTGDYADINYSGDITDADSSQQNVTITGNTSTSGSTLIALAAVSHVTVTGNTSTGSRNGTAIYLGGSVVDAAITGNTIDNAVRGIKVDKLAGYGANSGLNVNGNKLLANDADLVLTDGAVDATPLDASHNWWGGPGGPAPSSIQSSAGAVTYAPWCTDATCDTDSGSETHATRYVAASGASDANNDCGASADPCATIDHAIDVALPGDTVSVGAGRYQELVTVSKPINLVGAGAGSTTVDGSGDASGTSGVLHVATLTTPGSVAVSGFTFTGVSGVVGQPWPTVVIDDKNTADSISFTDNTIANTDTASQHDTRGVLVHTVPGTTTTIDHNVISGVTQGVLIENAGAVSVTNNEFTELNGLPWGADTTYAAQGVLVMAHTGKTVAGLVINGNTFHNYAGYGVLLRAGYATSNPDGSIEAEVTGNTFDLGAARDPSPTGPVTSAMYFRTYSADSVLTATVTGNSGTVADPSLPVVQDNAAGSTFHITASNNSIVVGNPNEISIDFTPPTSVVANGQPVEFHGVVTNNSTATVPNARYDLQLNVPDGVTAHDITLQYWDSAVGTAGDWVTAELTPDGDDATVLTGYLKAKSGFELPPGSFTMDLKVSFVTGFNGGTQATIGATATLVQVAADGTTINHLTGRVSHSTTVETLAVEGCGSPLASGTLTPADFYFGESKSEGHYAFLADGGLMIWTTGTDGSNRKIAGYVTDLHIPLASIGAPTLGYAPVAGTTMPGTNLWLDNGLPVDDPAHLAGMLVNEPNVTGTGYGDNWWATGDKDWGVGAVAGGGSTVSNAPLSAYLNRWPNAFVTAVGFSLGTLGADQVSFAGPINSISYGCTEYAIDPGPLGSIGGTVTAGGSPLADVVVTATIPPASTGTGTARLLAATTTAADTVVGTGTTDSAGHYSISGIPAGTGYTLNFDASHATGGDSQTGYDDPQSQTVSVASGGSTAAGTTSADDANGSITGTVTTFGAAPLAGVTVTATGPGSATTTMTAITDADGRYTLADLAAGDYTLAFERVGYNTVSGVPASAVDGTVATVDMTLTPQPQSISGTISDATSGSGIAGVRVVVKDADTLAWVQDPATTDPNGTYAFADVQPGNYIICAVKTGYLGWCSDDRIMSVNQSLQVNGALSVNGGSFTTATPSDHPGWSYDPEPAATQGAPAYVDDASAGHAGTGALDFRGAAQVDYYHGVPNLPLDQVTELSVSTNTATGVEPLVYQLRIYGAQNTDGTDLAADNGFSTLFTLLPTTGGTWADQEIDLAAVQWKSSRAIHGVPNQSTTATLSEIARNNPKAIVVVYGLFRGSSAGPVLETSALADEISFNGDRTDFENSAAPAPVELTSTATEVNGWANDSDLSAPSYVFGPSGADGVGSLRASVADAAGHVNWLHSVDPTSTDPTATVPLMGVQGLGLRMQATGTPVGYTLRILGANAPGSTDLAADDGFSSLNWEPAYNTGAGSDQGDWTVYQALENGLWWSSRAINGLTDHDTRLTLADIAIHNPNAVIYAYGINLGAGVPASTSYIDDVAFNGTVTDFEPDVATVEGTVSSGGTPIEGVKVTIRAAGGGWAVDPNSIVTDADGHYSVTNLPGAGYTVCFVKAGYAADCESINAPAPGTTTVNADLTAVTTSTITSTPSDTNGWQPDPDPAHHAPSFVVNPNAVAEAGHSGKGSIDLTLGPDTSSLTSFYRAANPADPTAGVPLSAITGMGFATRTPTGDLPVYQLIVCGSISGDDTAGPDCPGYTTLVWHPTISVGAGWQDVTIDPVTSEWWSTRDLGDLARADLTTLPEIIAANPDAVVAAYGLLRGSSGVTYPTAMDAYVDDVSLNGTVTDFEPNTADVTGTVTSAVSGAALPAATVTITLAGGTAPAASAVTGVDGGYSVTGLPTGDYQICFAKVAYTGDCSSVSVTTDGLAEDGTLVPAHLPTIDVAAAQSITVGATPVQFTGTAANPADGVDVSHARFDFAITGPVGLTADQLTLEYLDGSTWREIPLTDSGSVVTGSFGPSDGFLLPAGVINTTQFRASAAADAPTGEITVTSDLVSVDPGTGQVLYLLATDEDGSALVAQPTLTVDLPAYLMAGGDWAQFSGTLANPADGAAYDAVRYDVTMTVPAGVTAADLSVQYQQGTDWLDLPLTDGPAGSNTVTGYFGPLSGFPLGVDQTRTTVFRAQVVAGATAGPVTSTNTLDTVAPDGTVTGTLVSEDTATRIVTGPSISLDQPAALTIGAARVQYSGTTTNPAEPEGTSYSPVRYDFVMTGPAGFDASDLTVRYFEITDSNWHVLSLTDGSEADTVVGSFGPHNGFPLPAGASNTSQFTIQINPGAPTGAVTTVTNLLLLDDSGNPVNTLATDSVTSTVFQAPTMSIAFPDTLYTGAAATAFTGTTTNPSSAAVPDARYNVTLSTDAAEGLQAGDLVLEYNVGGVWQPVPVTASAGTLVGFFGPQDGFALQPGATTTQFRVAAAAGAPIGTVTTTVDLVQVDGDGDTIATLASTSGSTAVVPGPGSIIGTVTAAGSGDPLAGVRVAVYDGTTGDRAAAVVVTDVDGAYTVGGLAAGSYTLCFDASGVAGGDYVNTCDEDITVTSAATTTHDEALAAAVVVTCDPSIFWDVQGGRFCADITWLSQQDITTGFQDPGHTLPGFHPGANISRQAMAAFLYRFVNHVQEIPACSTGPLPFNDIAGTPFCGAVEWMFDEGLSTPYPDGGFHPRARITRQAMAAMIYRLVNGGDDLPSCTGTLPFNDIAGTPFCGAIQWMGEQGLSTPYPDGGYHPGESVSRQAMATILHRLADRTSITGTVTGTGDAALAGVSVIVTATDSSTAFSAVTAADGTYTVPGLSAGTYTVCFDPSGVAGSEYLLECYDGAVGNAAPDPVTVSRWIPTVADASLQAVAP